MLVRSYEGNSTTEFIVQPFETEQETKRNIIKLQMDYFTFNSKCVLVTSEPVTDFIRTLCNVYGIEIRETKDRFKEARKPLSMTKELNKRRALLLSKGDKER